MLSERAERNLRVLSDPASHAGRVSRKDIEDIAAALDEIDALRGAIREHHDQKGDDRCWLDDQKLYAAAGLEPAETALPARGDFLASCERYWCQRQRPEERTRPPGRTIGQLEREAVEFARLLRAASLALRSYQHGNSAADLAAEILEKIEVALIRHDGEIRRFGG